MRPYRLTAILLALAVVATGCAGKHRPPEPRPRRPPANPPPISRCWNGSGPMARSTKDTAVAAFSLAFGPLPGAALPDGPRRPVESGSLAVQWILRHWGSLTPEQQKAARAAIGAKGGGGGGLTGPVTTAAPKPNPNLSCPAKRFGRCRAAPRGVRPRRR